MILRLPILAAAVVILVGGDVAQIRNVEPDPLLARMWDSWTTLRPAAGPIIIENCAVVWSDGHFHMELRRQESMDSRTTLDIYEGALDNKSVQILKKILDADAIKKLTTPKSPRFPTDASLEGFSAVISRTEKKQDVGYFIVKAGPENPDNVVQEWQESQTALHPLVEWFRALKTYKNPAKHRVSNSQSTVCGLTPLS